MDQQDQQAMDGSPAVVTRMLGDLQVFGKFRGRVLGERLAGVIRIQFQCGPLQEVGVNGCSIEDVIDVLIERLQGFERGPFACRENRDALLHLKSAKNELLARTAARQAQHVEGTNAPHESG